MLRTWSLACAAPPSERASAGASRRTSFGMLTPSNSRARACPLIVIQRQLGRSNLGITSVYLQGIDNAEIIETVHARRQPMTPITTSLPRQ
jgi:hypothetical protein